MSPQRLIGSHILKESVLIKSMTNQVTADGVHMDSQNLLTYYMPTNLQSISRKMEWILLQILFIQEQLSPIFSDITVQ
uniref:Uncharacterized protein n=1 Tax=Medicago truncatula TaxID=3880 RepID=I3S528_MEDTR|nr:unknown [Medicago truncatula]